MTTYLLVCFIVGISIISSLIMLCAVVWKCAQIKTRLEDARNREHEADRREAR